MSTQIVNTHEAKSRLSELIRAAEEGDDIILARNGRPVAKIVPWPPTAPRRVSGAWAGKVVHKAGDDLIRSDADVVTLFDDVATPNTP